MPDRTPPDFIYGSDELILLVWIGSNPANPDLLEASRGSSARIVDLRRGCIVEYPNSVSGTDEAGRFGLTSLVKSNAGARWTVAVDFYHDHEFPEGAIIEVSLPSIEGLAREEDDEMRLIDDGVFQIRSCDDLDRVDDVAGLLQRKDLSYLGFGVHTVSTGDGWMNRLGSREPTASRYSKKNDATEFGRALARSIGTEHIIHNKDGSIGARNSYGPDSSRRPG